MISKAKHYIYIENQFFISSQAGGGIANTIASAIMDKIRQAITSRTVFRVYVLIPIHPEGDIADATIQQVMKWQFKTICRGETSLLSTLQSEFPNVDLNNYISFFCLRKYDVMNTCEAMPVTEQIYIHSKMLIIDDMYTMIGSANINDRSLMGSRDSESM